MAFLAEVASRHGDGDLRAGGAQLMARSIWPTRRELYTLHEVLYVLSETYQTNMRGTSVGYYALDWLGLRTVRVVCYTSSGL